MQRLVWVRCKPVKIGSVIGWRLVKGGQERECLYWVDFTHLCCFLEPCVSYMDFSSPDSLLQGGEGGAEK